MRQAIRRIIGGTDGAVLVEFTLFATLLVVAAIYTTNFGYLFYYQIEIQDAAQAGAQFAIAQYGTPQGYSSYPPSCVSSSSACPILVAVKNAMPLTGASNVTPAVTLFCGCPSNTGVVTTAITCHSSCSDGSVVGTYVTVSVHANYNSFIPYGLVVQNYTFTATSTVRIQ